MDLDTRDVASDRAGQVGPPGQPGRLAPVLSSFVGREAEIRELAALMDAPDFRLMTLTGPGGVGKTRLVLRLIETRPGPAVFVPLAPVTSADLVGSAIARSLGLRTSSGLPIARHLIDYLAFRQLVLVLDNFEHVLDAAPLVSELLTSCLGLRILVTSREALRLTGERVVHVQPLSLPSQTGPDPAAVLRGDAVRLFAERAMAASGLGLDAGNSTTIAQICQRLDGLPLAIELAAARTGHLPPAALLERLERRLPLLTGGPRDAPERHQTIRKTVAWSYDLLSPGERTHFRRLSVFRGGFTLAGARAVALPDGTDDETLEAIASLVSKCLLRAEDGSTDVPRYSMLETIREFGQECLAESGELERTLDRHACHMLAVAESRSPRLPLPGDAAWLRQTGPDHDNCRLALETFDRRGDHVCLLRLAAALYEFWLVSGHLNEGRVWLERGLAQATAAPVLVRYRALSAAGTLALFQGDYARAAACYEAERPLAEEIGQPYMIGESLIDVGLLAYRSGDLDQATELTRQAYDLLRQIPDSVPAAAGLAGTAISNLGDIAMVRGDLAEARSCYETACDLHRGAGYDWGLVESLVGLGRIDLARGDLVNAARLLGEGLALAQRLGDTNHYPTTILGLAAVAALSGQIEQGARLFGAAEALAEMYGLARFPRDAPGYQAGMDCLRSSLAPDALSPVWAAGRDFTETEWSAEARAVVQYVTNRPVRPTAEDLTAREREVLRLLVQGKTDREIAEALFITRRTVTTHTSHIFAKLQVTSRTEAATYAVRHHLV